MPVAVKLHTTNKPRHMIGNKERMRVCGHALEESMGTLPYYWRTEGISHFHENPGSSDQWLTQILRCLDGSSMETICRSEHLGHGNGFPWA